MKLESITIRVAENGFTVSCSEREDEDDKKKKSKGDLCCTSWEPPKDYVFESAEGALAYAKDRLTSGTPKYKSLADRVQTKKKGA